MTGRRRAAFLDRDGTLVPDAHYLRDAARLRLVPGAAEAIRLLEEASVSVVVVTNQSGIARGVITEEQYHETRRRLEALVFAAGGRITASYHCPHYPGVSGPCDCRKPGTGLFRRAAEELGIDLARSLYVGDRFRDVAPGLALGGLALLIPSPETPPDEVAQAEREAGIAPSLGDAVARFLAADA
jgi:histidinol-phosphate phosphatase family protein